MAFSELEDEQAKEIGEKLCDAVRGFYHPKVIVVAIGGFLHSVINSIPKEERKTFVECLAKSIDYIFCESVKELSDESESNEINADES